MTTQGFYIWSTTASTNASVDSSVNFAEGQAPSSLNDSNRAVMARLREFGNDIAGAITTGGSSTAYTVASNQVFDTLAHMNGQVIAFTPHTTNGATVTLNVDGLGAKPLRPAPNVELQSGVLIQGTPYIALYNNSDAVFYLRGVGTAPGVPLGSSFDYWGTSAPSTFFALAFGQAISRATYATLFTLFSTTYGTGDGSTTFNLPDLRGRVCAGKDDMGGSALGLIGTVATDNGTIVGTTLGSKGGTPTHILTTGEMPTHNHTITDPGHVHTQAISPSGGSPGGFVQANVSGVYASSGVNTFSNVTSITINNTGGGTAHALLQPTIMANKLLRII